jgi:hypothetical protein
MDSTTTLSRSGRTDPAGKLTARIDVPLTEELHESVIAMAALAGVGKAEYVRSVLERVLLGELNMVRMIARQRNGGI